MADAVTSTIEDIAQQVDHLPVTVEDMRNAGFPEGFKMATGLAVLFNEPFYLRCKAIALRMSGAQGMVPQHLIGRPNACFAVVTRSITWNLDPFAVAGATYEVNGKVGYEGKLIHAILEASGLIDGRIVYDYQGDWKRLYGKFKLQPSNKPGSDKKTPIATYTEADEEGLSLVIRAKLKGDSEAREEEFFLREMHPRNSTLWVTRPRQQMGYTSIRAYANIVLPHVLMGVPFDIDPSGFYDGTEAGNPRIAPPRPTAPRGDNAFSREEEVKPDPIINQTIEGTAEEVVRDPAPSDAPTSAKAGPEQANNSQAAEEEEERPLDRGRRLLALCKTILEVSDLRMTILEEILDDDVGVATWHMACDDRSKVLTGPKGAPEAATPRGKPVVQPAGKKGK